MRFLLLVAVLAGCVIGDSEDPADDFSVDSLAVNKQLLKRVVIARMYQKTEWTLPAAGTTVAERVAYVCGELVPLHATYVSGLIRLDDDKPLSADQIAIFVGVRDCVKPAKLDVVLNAEHYTDPTRHPDGTSARTALEARAKEIKDTLGVDIIFFDFFNSPYNAEHAGWYHDRFTDGTKYIRKTLGMRVGGNVWGMAPPPNADFIALDNFDRPSVDGFAFDQKQIAAMGKKLPIMIHVENNPQKKDSNGLAWIDGTFGYRVSQLDKYAGAQHDDGFAYMYPVLFPLQCCVGAACGPSKCDVAGSDRHAYDAGKDGDMLARIGKLMDRY